MPSSKKRSRRRRGVVLSPQGWQRLQTAQRQFEVANNSGLPYTIEELSELTQLSPNTLSKVRACKVLVDRQTLEVYFNTFELELTSADCDVPTLSSSTTAGMPERSQPNERQNTAPANRQDWGEAIDVSIFHGRAEELATLSQWIGTDHCRLIGILGMGGIGKTALAAKLAQQIQGEFDFVVWRSLRNAPPLESLLGELVPFLSGQQQLEPEIRLLLQCLQAARCLVVLDNIETILQPEQQAGYYRPGYENYAELFCVVGESQHKSCVLLTSREKPAEIAMLEGAELPVRSLAISGSLEMALALVNNQRLKGTAAEKQKLCECYGCSPLALKITASSILDLFEGDIAQFLAEDTVVFNGVRRLLAQQFERLSDPERSIMYWLAVSREWISVSDLAVYMIPKVARFQLLESLASLTWRSLIETKSGQYTQQPVVMEYVTSQMIQQASEEIQGWEAGRFSDTLPLWRHLSFLQLQTKDYIQDTQLQLIVRPIVEGLTSRLTTVGAVEAFLKRLLQRMQQDDVQESGYIAGNIINMLRQLQVEFVGYDLSGLTIRQADFQGMTLHSVDLMQADVTDSRFSQALGGLMSVACSPDNKVLAAGDDQGILHLWDVQKGKYLKTVEAHLSQILGLNFSADGQRLVTGSADGNLKLWDTKSYECLYTLQAHNQVIYKIAFSTDGQYFASCSEDGMIKIWSVEQCHCLQTLCPQVPMRSVAWTPDNQHVVGACDDHLLRLWEVESGQCLRIFKGHKQSVEAVDISADGRWMISGGAAGDAALRLWELRTGNCHQVLSGHTQQIWDVRFSPDSKTIASSSFDKTARLWSRVDGQPLACLKGHTDWVLGIAFTSNGQHLISGSLDQTLKQWQVEDGLCWRTLMGHSNVIWSVDFLDRTRNGLFKRPLVCGGQDGTVRVWDLDQSQWLYVLKHPPIVRSVALSPNGGWLVSGNINSQPTLRVWNLQTGEQVRVWSGHQGGIMSLRFHPNGQFLASSSEDGIIKIWSVESGYCLKTLAGHEGLIWGLDFSSDGQYLVSASHDQTARIWDVQSGNCIRTFGISNHQHAVTFSSSDRKIVTGGADGRVRIWSVETGKCEHTLAHDNIVLTVTVAQGGHQVVSGSFDKTIRFWDVSSGKCLKIWHTEMQVCDLVVSVDGQTLISAGSNGTIQQWDVATGQCIETIKLPGPYAGMNIRETKGLTEAQAQMLMTLGAVQ